MRCPARCSEAGGSRKRGLISAIQEETAREIETLVGNELVELLDLEAVETAARRLALSVAAKAIEERLNADHSDEMGPRLPCRGCDAFARFVGRRRKTFESALGPLTLGRAYYHCAHCDAGFCPRDEALGLSRSTLTPAVTRMVGAVGACVAFEEGRQLLAELADVHLDAKTVERVSERLGEEIARDEKTLVDQGEPCAPTLYLGLDGTGIPMRRKDLEGRPGKQPDGSSKTREVKLCTVWSAEGRDDKGVPVRDPGSVSYSAAIERAATTDLQQSLSNFALRVQRESTRRGFDSASRRVVLGDGAAWIWNIADTLFPGAIQIVDRFHVKQHLSDVAKSVWGPDSDLGRQWAKDRHAELDEGQIDQILSALSRHAHACEQARQCVDYISRNRSRMDYLHFRQKGLCTSTGVVEAGCKVVVGARLKRAGMHWSLSGANAILALRCSRLSGRFEDFWERRTDSAA